MIWLAFPEPYQICGRRMQPTNRGANSPHFLTSAKRGNVKEYPMIHLSHTKHPPYLSSRMDTDHLDHFLPHREQRPIS